MTTDPGSTVEQVTPVLVSVSEEYYPAAVTDLRGTYGERLAVRRLGPDLAAVTGVRLGRLAADCRQHPLVFVRHLTRQVGWLDPPVAADPAAVGRAALDALADAGAGPELSLQCWASGEPAPPPGPAQLARHLTGVLTDHGYAVSRAGRDTVLSACLTHTGLALGLAPLADSLTDWPGGRVRLARPPGQISRAEFKLEELFKVFPVPLPDRGAALDLGASPGGWTRVLRNHGLTVTAVDPGDLHPAVAADPGVRHARTTAGRFLPGCRTRFDVVTNDMKMTPERSSEVMLAAADHLRPDGLAILTLKLGGGHPARTVRSTLRRLATRYRILLARQLHHNRHEVTVVAQLLR